jgi:hypothetical protein
MRDVRSHTDNLNIERMGRDSNPRGIAERYLAALDSKPWDNERFKRLVGEAQAAFEKSLRDCQHA